MKEKLKGIKPRYEFNLSNGKRIIAIFLWSLVVLEIILSKIGGYTSELPFLFSALFPLAILIFCKEHIELAFIPTLFNAIKSIKSVITLKFAVNIDTGISYIGILITIALIVVIIVSLYKNISPALLKALAIASIVITLARIVNYAVTTPQFELLTIFTIIRLTCNGLAWFVVYFNIEKKDITSINITKLIVTLLIVAISYFALSGILGQNQKLGDSTRCNHPECKENGPFPCYGKNNTCPNKTYCYQDLYCDYCD